MAELDTGQDILRAVVRRAGEIVPTSTDETTADWLIDIKIAIDQAYGFVCGWRPWRWNRIDPPQQVASTAKIDVTQVSVVGAVVTLSAAPAAADGSHPSVAGRKYTVDGDAIPARISTHVANSTSLTLSANYTGSQTGSASAHIFLDEITLPTAVLAYPEVRELHIGDYLTTIPEAMFRQKYPRNILGSVRANYATFITTTKFRIGPWTNDARLFEVAGNAVPSPLTFDGVAATDTPVIPRWSRGVLVSQALLELFPNKRDSRLSVAEKEVERILTQLERQEISFAKPRSWIPKGGRIV